MRENLKKCIDIENVIRAEDTLMHAGPRSAIGRAPDS